MNDNSLTKRIITSLTECENFSREAENAKGKKANCYCTSCGHPLSLHEKMDGGYCEKCGDYITLKSALNCEFTEDAIIRIDMCQLYRTEKRFGALPPVSELKKAADRGYVPACNLLAYHYFMLKDYDNSYHYSEKGIQAKDGDGAFFFAASCSRSGELSTAKNFSDTLDVMETAKNDLGLRMPQSEELYEKEYLYVKDRYETLASLESITKSSYSPSDYSSNSSSSSGISDEDWDNFTFMNSIIDRMHNDKNWGDDTKVSEYDPYAHDPESFPADTECFPDSSQIW